MAERDWLGELTEAIGDDGDRARPPAADLSDLVDHDDPHTEGPGRDIDGWTEQLAEAFGDEGAIEAPPDSPAVEPQAPIVTTPVPSPAPAALAPEVAAMVARLARVEAILGADLEKLGPAVLAESVAGLDAQLQSLQVRLAGLDIPTPVAPEAVVAPVDLTEVLARFDDVVARVDGLAAVAQQPVVAPHPAPEVDLSSVLARFDELGARVDRLAAVAQQPVVAPDPAVAQLGAFVQERFASLAQQLTALEQAPPAGPPAAHPAPEVDLTGVLARFDELGARFDELADVAQQPVVAPDPAVAQLGAFVQERFASLAEQLAGVEGLAERVDALARVADQPLPPDPSVAQLGTQLAALASLLDERLAAQSQSLAVVVEGIEAAEPSPPVDLTGVLHGLDGLAGRIDALAEVADQPLAPDPHVARLAVMVEERFAALAGQLDALERTQLVAMAAPAPEPAPQLDELAARVELVIAHLATPRNDLAAVTEQVAALADRFDRLESLVQAVPERLAVEAEVVVARAATAGSATNELLLDEIRAKLDAMASTASQQTEQLAAAIDASGGTSTSAVGPSDLASLGQTITAALEQMRREIAAGRIDLDAEQVAKSLNSLGRRIVSLEQLQANAMAVDERAEMRLRELLNKLDNLTSGLLG